MGGIKDLISEIAEWPYGLEYLPLIVALAWLSATLWYTWRLRETRGKINLANIALKGGIAKELGSKEAGFIIRSHLAEIDDTYQRSAKNHESVYAAEAVTVEFPCMDRALMDVMFELGPPEIQVQGDITIKVLGLVDVPIGAIINVFMALFKWLPVPRRRRYLDSLIYISLTSIGDETKLFVYGKGGSLPMRKDPNEDTSSHVTHRSLLLTKTATTKNLTDLVDLLRDATFMILELYGNFDRQKSQSMRYFFDGLDNLDDYRYTNREELLEECKANFAKAAAADWKNYHALYFYGSMLMVERTNKSIARAMKLFKQALNTNKMKLKALVNNGLANCYIQRYHRLARREKNVKKEAAIHVKEAVQNWKSANCSADIHPLMVRTCALIGIIDEGKSASERVKRKRFINSAQIMFRAVKMEPNNGVFQNDLGWIFMKMAEWGEPIIEAGGNVPEELLGIPAEIAERHLRIALDLNPSNKRIHANLCLLYATPHYRAKEESYLSRCRFHGRMAVKIDPGYVNGYRDLAISMLRYEEFDEAYKYFEKALLLATQIAKDLEIIEDVAKVLADEKKLNKKRQLKWLHPDDQLLVPPEETD